MSKVCPRCGCVNIEKEPDDWYNEDLVTCMRCDMIFPRAELADATLFQCITASPEVLAEEFVEPYTRWGDDGHLETLWRSNFRELSGMLFDTREEAISATVAKLR